MDLFQYLVYDKRGKVATQVSVFSTCNLNKLLRYRAHTLTNERFFRYHQVSEHRSLNHLTFCWVGVGRCSWGGGVLLLKIRNFGLTLLNKWTWCLLPPGHGYVVWKFPSLTSKSRAQSRSRLGGNRFTYYYYFLILLFKTPTHYMCTF